jgi:hypothetical protein
MIFSVTGIELFFLDLQVFLAQTKKASVLEIERKFVLFFKKSCAILFSSCILVTLKFIAGQQVCRPSRAEKGLKDWAIAKWMANNTRHTCAC